jgi:long-chain acyl-CoA synthetase
MFINPAYDTNLAAIADSGEQLSYSDLQTRSLQLFANIGHRCLVFCLCKNAIDSLVGYVSFISNRIVPLMLDASLEIEMLRKLISTYNPEYLWIPIEKLDDFLQEDIIFTTQEYSLVKVRGSKPYPLFENLALLLTTSGSTGSPKLVRLSYDNITANANSIAQYLSITAIERPITALPMNYSFGLSIINSHLLQGATLLLTNRSLMEKEFWLFLKNEKATSFSGVPYTYEMLKRLRFFRMDLPSLTTLTQAGGKLNIDLNREFVEYCHSVNKRFVVMYGQTEATARMSYLPFEQATEKLGSIGVAIPGGTFSLIDDQGHTINDIDQSGELIYSGANVSLGYAECGEDLDRSDENNGVLFTGDLAKHDSDNFYYIVGRKKRFIKLFGNRINLDETEQLLKNLITECACIGTDDKMVVYITEQGREAEAIQYISSKIGINHTAFDVRFCNSIPKNSSGKTLYANLEL